MEWKFGNGKVTETAIKSVENLLNVKFPEDFLEVIMLYDGSYPNPNVITIEGNDEVVNNLVSFLQGDASFVVDIIEDTESFKQTKLVPIAEDPFGNLFCYDFSGESTSIVFWNSEKSDNVIKVCNSFEEFLKMLHE